jgi:IS30 family transposase
MIAAELGVHPSTISRELGRNTGLRGYRPNQAQQKALQRRFKNCMKFFIRQQIILFSLSHI